MKKLIPILLAVFALVSCEKDPDMDKLDNEYLVFTSHDTSTKFNDFSTYYIPDSILIIGDKKDPEYWKDENAQTIINAFKTKMNAAGYTAVDKDDADLGLQVSYVASTYYFHGYYNDGPWWGYYPGYWYPGYWGGNWGGGWYYPYPITYSYSTGSLLADMINLKKCSGRTKREINCCLECIHQRVAGWKWQFECKPYNYCHQPSIHSESLSEKINVSETSIHLK